jgi:hypothetical protein
VAALEDRLLDGLDDDLPCFRSGTSFTVLGQRLAVTVIASPCRKPLASRYFISAGVPPMLCRSSCT